MFIVHIKKLYLFDFPSAKNNFDKSMLHNLSYKHIYMLHIYIIFFFFRTWVAISYGVLLSCLHTIISVVVMDSELRLLTQWQQVAANIIILLSVNLVGIFIHNLTEEGQRRAFLDTRDCIAARLEMEDENEKLVRAL
jgi:hypothetical protein